MKKILRRRMVRRAAMTGISLLNLILSSRAPATPLDKQFIIPLTPKTTVTNNVMGPRTRCTDVPYLLLRTQACHFDCGWVWMSSNERVFHILQPGRGILSAIAGRNQDEWMRAWKDRKMNPWNIRYQCGWLHLRKCFLTICCNYLSLSMRAGVWQLSWEVFSTVSIIPTMNMAV